VTFFFFRTQSATGAQFGAVIEFVACIIVHSFIDSFIHALDRWVRFSSGVNLHTIGAFDRYILLSLYIITHRYCMLLHHHYCCCCCHCYDRYIFAAQTNALFQQENADYTPVFLRFQFSRNRRRTFSVEYIAAMIQQCTHMNNNVLHCRWFEHAGFVNGVCE
jgi:hypothetical protein